MPASDFGDRLSALASAASRDMIRPMRAKAAISASLGAALVTAAVATAGARLDPSGPEAQADPVTGAAASRPASRGTKRGLRGAVRRSRFVAPSVRQGRFRLRRARVSLRARDPWATATIVATGEPLDPALAVFKKRRRWKLVDIGTSGVGCRSGTPPRKVRVDLGLRCP